MPVMKVPFFSRDRWDIESVNPAWGDRPSIYQHIRANIRPGEPGLGEKGDLLSDEEIVRGGEEIPLTINETSLHTRALKEQLLQPVGCGKN
jgi:hypothetical protein